MLQFSHFKNLGIYHGITDSSFPYVTEESGLPAKLVKEYSPLQMEQIHNNLSMICVDGDSGIVEGADALVSNVPKQLLVIRSADCAPILMFDPEKSVVAVIHGGRRSVTWGIIKQAIDNMRTLGTAPENILVGLGPHIRSKNYEIGEGVMNQIGESTYKNFIQLRKGKAYFDLTEAIFSDLIEEGILLHNIEDCGIDTYEDYEKYFSYRRWSQNNKLYEGRYRTFGSFIGLS